MKYYTHVESPIGKLWLVSDGASLTALYLPGDPYGEQIQPNWVENPEATPFPQARAQVDEYFNGRRKAFDLPLAPEGTAFQVSVWQALRAIPYGTTTTYKDLAARIGQPKSIRAVGQANGRNPAAIIIPCHRVVGTDGSLTGYGGGIQVKAALLEFEQSVAANGPRRFFPGG